LALRARLDADPTSATATCLTARDAGRLGGLVVLERHGRHHYRRIGRLGGESFTLRHGDSLATESRRRGGETARDRYGDEHYRRIGRRGGEATSERHGPAFHRRLGQLVSERYGAAHYARLSAMSAATLSYLHGLQRARLRRGLSNAALARRSGVSRPAIAAFERLERGARRATVEKLAEALGCEPGDLLSSDRVGGAPSG
jgi:DNA-binding Xre family transcriptional regulator